MVPLLVSILRQGSYLIASIHEALNDREIVQFQQDVVEQIGIHRARGIIIDVAALDVMDSFGSRTLLTLAAAAARPRWGARRRRSSASSRPSPSRWCAWAWDSTMSTPPSTSKRAWRTCRACSGTALRDRRCLRAVPGRLG